MPGLEVLGEALVVGDAAAVSVRYSLPGEPAEDVAGFVVIVGDRVTDGVLAGGAARFLATGEPTADVTVAEELMAAQVAAWNAEDVEGVLATMSDDAALWGDLADPDAIGSGAAVREAVIGAFPLRMEMTGAPVTSGPFAAVPLQFTSETVEGWRNVIAIIWVRHGRLALTAVAQGELVG